MTSSQMRGISPWLTADWPMNGIIPARRKIRESSGGREPFSTIHSQLFLDQQPPPPPSHPTTNNFTRSLRSLRIRIEKIPLLLRVCYIKLSNYDINKRSPFAFAPRENCNRVLQQRLNVQKVEYLKLAPPTNSTSPSRRSRAPPAAFALVAAANIGATTFSTSTIRRPRRTTPAPPRLWPPSPIKTGVVFSPAPAVLALHRHAFARGRQPRGTPASVKLAGLDPAFPQQLAGHVVDGAFECNYLGIQQLPRERPLSREKRSTRWLPYVVKVVVVRG